MAGLALAFAQRLWAMWPRVCQRILMPQEEERWTVSCFLRGESCANLSWAQVTTKHKMKRFSGWKNGQRGRGSGVRMHYWIVDGKQMTDAEHEEHERQQLEAEEREQREAAALV